MTGIKLTNCNDIEINACDINHFAIGVEISGTSNSLGSIASFQGFGLNIAQAAIAPVETKSYQFKIDGNVFTIKCKAGMTYGDLISAINAAPEFYPTYRANIENGDVIIRTMADTIDIERPKAQHDLIAMLACEPTPMVKVSQTYASFGLSKFNNGKGVDPNDLAVIIPDMIYTFGLDGKEVAFLSQEADGTTWAELFELIKNHKVLKGYDMRFTGGDFVIYRAAASVTLSDGTRFKHLFQEIGTTYTRSQTTTDIYQLLNVDTKISLNLPPTTYSILVNNQEYSFEVIPGMTWYGLCGAMNEQFEGKFTASVYNDNIKIQSYSDIKVDKIQLSLFQILGVNPTDAINGAEDSRSDRSFNIRLIGNLIHHNQTGVRMINCNDVDMDENQVYYNNVGVWQLPSSYHVFYRGEVYENKTYGIRNTDKTGGDHDIDASETWWGSRRGPSGVGPGDGDKVSSNVIFAANRLNGSEPELSYPNTKNFILGMLGYPTIKVELTNEQLQMCVDKATFKFTQYMTPKPTYYPVYCAGGIGILSPGLSKDEIMAVYSGGGGDVGDLAAMAGMIPDSFLNALGTGNNAMMIAGNYGAGYTYYAATGGITITAAGFSSGSGAAGGGMPLTEIYTRNAYLESMAYNMGTIPTYELYSAWDAGTGKYQDHIRVHPAITGLILIKYNRPLNEEELDSLEWVQKYALTWGKEMLGRVRSKYATIPGPGGDITMDGAALLSEATTDRAECLKELYEIQPPILIDIG
jgi:hypothetical protein